MGDADPPADEGPGAERILAALAAGEVALKGRMPWSSNATFLAEVGHDGLTLPVIYKPARGERPLWDFPSGLYRREVAAYRLSEALGWGLVPETVTREEAPLGPGSLQRFVPSDFAQHYFTLMERPELRAPLRTICAFDLVANNADRKAGHCLLGEDGRIWAIDNGLCFNADPGLRTVIWDFGGERVPDHLRADLERVAAGDLAAVFEGLLDDEEVDATRHRAAVVARLRTFPEVDESRRSYPWPLV